MYSQNSLAYYENNLLNANKLKSLRLASCKKKITASGLISQFVRKSGTFAGGFGTEHLGVFAGKANQRAKWPLKSALWVLPAIQHFPREH